MKKTLAVLVALTAPMFAFAQSLTYSGSSGLGGIITFISTLLGYLFPLIITLSVVFIIWQIFRFAVAGGEDDKSKAKTHIIWGIVGLFVMVSIWGLVGILQSTFHLNSYSLPPTILP